MNATVRGLVLVLVGTVAMAGDLLGLPSLYAIGLATSASPAPKVFTEREGLEGFSATYTLTWTDADGVHTLPLDPEGYQGIPGPYNRRNVYGAALAGGPFLASHPQLADLHAQVARYAFCEADVLSELGAPGVSPSSVHLRVTPREGTQTDLPLQLEVRC